MDKPHHIFDRAVYMARQHRAKGDAARLLDQRIAEDLQDRLAVINHRFDHAALVTARPEAPLKILEASGKCLKISVLSPSPDDTLNLAENSIDALFSLLDLQTINDVPGHLAQAARALRPDGLAMFAFFAGETVKELREAWLAAETDHWGGVSPRVAPMIDLRETGGLLQRAGLALPVADMDRTTLRYPDAFAVMREIKALGFSNPLVGRSTKPVSGSLLAHVAAHYHLRHADPDGRIRATVEIAWAMAWKPHPSQQQPLKPGSAKARLADALKVNQTPQ
jgi:SAM-dependent methyltransferase